MVPGGLKYTTVQSMEGSMVLIKAIEPSGALCDCASNCRTPLHQQCSLRVVSALFLLLFREVCPRVLFDNWLESSFGGWTSAMLC